MGILDIFRRKKEDSNIIIDENNRSPLPYTLIQKIKSQNLISIKNLIIKAEKELKKIEIVNNSINPQTEDKDIEALKILLKNNKRTFNLTIEATLETIKEAKFNFGSLNLKEYKGIVKAIIETSIDKLDKKEWETEHTEAKQSLKKPNIGNLLKVLDNLKLIFERIYKQIDSY